MVLKAEAVEPADEDAVTVILEERVMKRVERLLHRYARSQPGMANASDAKLRFWCATWATGLGGWLHSAVVCDQDGGPCMTCQAIMSAHWVGLQDGRNHHPEAAAQATINRLRRLKALN